ncbi:Hypothetical predicted protein [Cloeon dipterum]|uniref:Transposable element P transposase n=1 Tax=Cloeon dipterum TaxID=197152 RepID=A0A8S1D6G7_9INSE|nr:Hypothetical predicted protein [Cloeon dipterum]
MSAKEKKVSVTFDEVAISGDYVYDAKQDQVLGGKREALVVMAAGIFAPWKTPFYLGFKQELSVDLVYSWIEKLHEVGFTAASITSDLGPKNQKLYRLLNVTKERPFFLSPCDGKKVFVFADPPHMLKLCRNHLIDQQLVLNSNEEKKNWIRASCQPLAELVHLRREDGIDEDLTNKKMLAAHLKVKGAERQKVRIAAETCSRTTAAMLSKYKDRLSSEHVDGTIKYILATDTVFDIFNVKEDLREKGLGHKIPTQKLPFGAEREKQEEMLENIKNVFSQMRKILPSGSLSTAMDPYQKGILWNCKSLPEMTDFLKEDLNDPQLHILTYYLNQDCLENMFSSIRAYGGTHRNPDQLEFIHRLNKYLLAKSPDIILQHVNNNTEGHLQQFGLCADALEELSELDSGEEDVDSQEKRDFEGGAENEDEEQETNDLDVNLENAEEEMDEMDSTDEEYTLGLEGLAAILAFRLRADSSLVGSTQENDNLSNMPAWISPYSKIGFLNPSDLCKSHVFTLDGIFGQLHGEKWEDINMNQGVAKRFEKLCSQKAPEVPLNMVRLFAKLRLLAKMRFKNRKSHDRENKRGEHRNKQKTSQYL